MIVFLQPQWGTKANKPFQYSVFFFLHSERDKNKQTIILYINMRMFILVGNPYYHITVSIN